MFEDITMRNLLVVAFASVLVCICSEKSFCSGPETPKILLSKSNPDGSGVQIAATPLTDHDTDLSYRNFEKTKNGKLDRYDFYYSLEIVPQFKSKFSNCEKIGTFPSFFKTLLSALGGVSKGGLVLIKGDVQYRWATGIQVPLLANDIPLVLAAIGASPTAATPGNGCFFDETIRPTFPLMLYNGGGGEDKFDDFSVRLIIVGGVATEYKLLENVVNLFAQASGTAGWAPVTAAIAGPAFQNALAASQSFERALQAAGTLQHQITIDTTLRANDPNNLSRLAITIPDLFGSDPKTNGNMAIFVRRVGSIVLSSQINESTLSISSVTENLQLSNRQCDSTTIATGGCTNSGNETIRVALAKLLAPIDPGLVVKGAGGNPSNGPRVGADPNGTGAGGVNAATSVTVDPTVRLFNLDDPSRSKLIYHVCDGLRTISRLNLHLSTVDVLLVRWAFTKESGLQDLLLSAKPADAGKVSDLAKVNGVSAADLTNMCWSKDDTALLAKVIAKQ